MNEKDVSPRVITVGDSGVGKTSIIHRIKSGTFLEQTVPTIGAGVTPIEVEVDGKSYSFQFWDTAGQEMYRNIIPIYFKGAVVAVLVFSMCDAKSFQSLDSWLEQVEENASDNIILLALGNKIDVQPPQVSEEEAKRWAKSKNIDIFFTSAKTGQNTELIMQHIATAYESKKHDNLPMDDIRVAPQPVANEKKGCC